MVELSEREQELPDLEIDKLLEIAVEHPEIISLGPGEPDFELHPSLVAHTKRLAHKVNHYAPPGGFKELREEICKKLKKGNKIKVSPDNVVVTCGSQEALMLATACCLDVSEQIILPDPGFMGFLPTFELFNANPRFVELKEEDDYAVNPDAVKKAVNRKKTKVLLINSPANPTGNVLSKKILEELADIAVEHDLYIFSDEAYEHILYDGAKHYSIASFNGMEDYAVTFQTFSKSYAMCGHRLGYVVCNEDLAEAIKKTHILSTICAPSISQLIGLKALKMGDRHAKQMVKEYDRRRNLIVPALNEMGISCPMPKGAFYAFGNIRQFDDNSKRFCNKMIKEAKVAAVPGIDFGTVGEGHARFSFATDYKLIQKALKRMEPWLKKYRKR
ncbi:aminotransferase class I/II-fold pyridoxal phosphate-dependent enzyme [Candidatus Woesearchaeota archaeon]|nr:aminotransferase class I/II-fold pyridoxal phosphate-dependent enzyme [Candidatus Woesearchaeota archaeon]